MVAAQVVVVFEDGYIRRDLLAIQDVIYNNLDVPRRRLPNVDWSVSEPPVLLEICRKCLLLQLKYKLSRGISPDTILGKRYVNCSGSI